jgi:2-polyprenyl-3-methyl-5-hydroxy-6-metoxy-1,4-benzoquinol methylase
LIARRAIRRLGLPRALRSRLRSLRPLDRRDASVLTLSNSRRAYDALFRSPELLDQYLQPSRLEFYEEVAASCAELAPASAVDIGCATGHLLRALVNRLPEVSAVGLDHAASGIEVARELVPEATFVVGDLYRTAPPERFDLVLCTEVLEHLRRPRQAVKCLVGWCAPGGHVVISVPDGAVDAWEGHVNFWSEDDLRELLAPYGLESITRIDEGRTLLAVLAPGS